jgi:hypothetical protein
MKKIYKLKYNKNKYNRVRHKFCILFDYNVLGFQLELYSNII